ncbi:hypothetical protein [Pedobacter sp. R-06]|uniref:hypothetical protein n=1 Tax=Pedobacter sp. R-06 TaxID=3404051 RepID=UPI003CE84F87
MFKKEKYSAENSYVLDVEILTFDFGIFFEGRTGEDYAEVFLNIDLMDNWLELREMDKEYQPSITVF